MVLIHLLFLLPHRKDIYAKNNSKVNLGHSPYLAMGTDISPNLSNPANKKTKDLLEFVKAGHISVK